MTDRSIQRGRLRLAFAAGVLLLVVGAVVIERSGADSGPDELGNLWDVVGGLIAGGGILTSLVTTYLLRPSWFADFHAENSDPYDTE